MDTRFRFRLLSDMEDIRADHVLIELATVEDITRLDGYTVPPAFIADIKKKFAKRPKKTFHISTYADVYGPRQLHIIHSPRTEERVRTIAEAVRSIGESVAFLDAKRARDDLDEILMAIDALVLGSYTYEIKSKDPEKRVIEYYIPRIPRNSRPEIERRLALLDDIYRARDLVNTGSSEKYPAKIVEMIQSLTWERTRVRIIDTAELQKMDAGLLLAVGRGSIHAPYLVIFERVAGAKESKKKERRKLAFVGKGITFDSGGLQIKPDTGMADMKSDMSGAAAVIAAMHHLDSIESLPCDIVGAIALAENMLDSNAYKPGDIVRSHSGKTVEIGHTDAEGRLVLADAISIVESEYHPDSIITIATLTGACMVALGDYYAGVFGDDEYLIRRIIGLSDTGSEKFWRLPIDTDIIESIKSDIADINNVTSGGGKGA